MNERHHDNIQEQKSLPSLAYQLWQPWRLIVMNPIPVFLAFVIANTVFVTFGGFLRLLSDLLTLAGLLVILLFSLILAIRRLASLIAYPGQLKLVIREGEATFARLTKRRLQIFAEAASELAQVLDLDTGKSTKPGRLRFLQVHQNFAFAFETMMLPVVQSLEIVERDGNLGPNGKQLLQVLQEIAILNSQKLAEPCSKLCSASEKVFEMQRVRMFSENEIVAPVSAKTTEKGLIPLKLLEGVSKPVLKMSTNTVDSASLEAEAAVIPKLDGVLHPLVAFEVALRRLQAVIPLIGRPQTDAPATRNVNWIAKEICRGSTPEVDYIATLEMLRADITARFKGEQIWIPGYQGHQVDAMLMPPASSGRDAVDRPVVVLCNPNGGLYEFHHLQMDWVKFYTADLDCFVLVYNYRGYGRCKGSPSPAMHNLDGLAIVEYLKTERKIERIAVHGESIGGLVATYVARMSPHVSVLIADRTFATVSALAQRMIARWAGTVVDHIMRWETDNVQNYLSATCAKLLCSDPCDDIILDEASLKSGVALNLELGDKTFKLPRQRKADGSPTSLASQMNIMRNIRLRCGPQSTHRVSEAASHPLLGEPLTEAIVARFSEAVLSVGRRALDYTSYRDNGKTAGGHDSKTNEEAGGPDETIGATSPSHVAISVEDAAATTTEDESATDNEQHSMLPSDTSEARAAVTATSAFPNKLLAVIWMQLARLDGYCGQVLLQAAENGGYDKIRAWTVSLLTWGGRLTPQRRNVRSLEPFDHGGIFIVPTTVAEVHTMLQHLVEQYPALRFDYDISFVVLMVEYLNDALQRRWRHLDNPSTDEPGVESEGAQNDKKDNKTVAAEQSKAAIPLLIDTGDPSLGCLLPLHCGHNKNYEDTEKQALIGFLQHVGFVEPTK
ncbi:unnamed protein product [Peronospora belbahrii]|uniref:AB hydrolase-1 domain-containing protein n=1 Tax=Peronospora belbahrii TaxID=622444 RepID=A0AAU9LRA1_9STRA|nr:unnamed protein product [Peronospora belbahrii]